MKKRGSTGIMIGVVMVVVVLVGGFFLLNKSVGADYEKEVPSSGLDSESVLQLIPASDSFLEDFKAFTGLENTKLNKNYAWPRRDGTVASRDITNARDSFILKIDGDTEEFYNSEDLAIETRVSVHKKNYAEKEFDEFVDLYNGEIDISLIGDKSVLLHHEGLKKEDPWIYDLAFVKKNVFFRHRCSGVRDDLCKDFIIHSAQSKSELI